MQMRLVNECSSQCIGIRVAKCLLSFPHLKMSAHIPNNGKPNIVVVGGGYGAAVARTLSASLDASKHNLILIDPRPYRIHLIATARMVVSDRDALEKTAFARFDKVFHDGKGTFVQAAVTAVQKRGKKGGSVTLDNGEKVPCDVLVLATGANWPGPLAFPNDEEAVTEWLATRRKEFDSAKSVVIAGGGAVGLGALLLREKPFNL